MTKTLSNSARALVFSMMAALFAVSLLLAVMPTPVRAASLTEPQIQAIEGLLAAFDVDEETIATVDAILRAPQGEVFGTSTSSFTDLADSASVGVGQSSFLPAAVVNNVNSTSGSISGAFGSSTIVISASAGYGGAIYSLTWKGMEFINTWDLGRELQSASSFNRLGEDCNPTEAGNSTVYGSVPSTLQSLNVVGGSTLKTTSLLQFWNPPQCNSPRHSFSKVVKIGFAGIPNVIEHDVIYHVPTSFTVATFEALTAYMTPSLSQFWGYDPATKALTPLPLVSNSGVGVKAKGSIIFSTPDGKYALGVYSPGSSSGIAGPGYAGWSFSLPGRGNSTNKWNCVYHLGSAVPAGDYEFKCYSIVGSLADVENGIDRLFQYYEPVVTVTASPGIASSANPGAYTITRTSVLPVPVTVTLALSGSAVRITDYTLLGLQSSTTVIIPSDVPSVTLRLIPRKVMQGTKNVTLSLATSSQYAVGLPGKATLIISNDTQPPAVLFAAPLDGATISTTTTLVANAADSIGVAGVQFKVDNQAIGAEATTTPYTLVWNSRSVPNGSHLLAAVARDGAGNRATSTVTVTTSNDLTPPAVSITAPGPGSVVSGTTTISAAATDDSGIAFVRFTVDKVRVAAADKKSPYTILWDSTSIPNGSHTITAFATDVAGNMTTSGVAVTVSNPTLALSANPTSVAYNGTTTITWSASGVTSCEVTGDGALLGSGTSGAKTTRRLISDTTYTLTCQSTAGIRSVQTTVTVIPKAVLSITADPAVISKGSTSTITWSAKNVVSGSCAVTIGATAVFFANGESGSQQTAALKGSARFFLRCTDLSNLAVAKAVLVTVGIPGASPLSDTAASVVMAPFNLMIDSLSNIFVLLGIGQ